ncbi:hypothetical protein F2P81_014229 [Scophthalmus maximus]|uniref:Uncharacterized protein n=1 Tax=Scophthalmus maximus TaxID=52904 RepID=A0A6A4SJ68_SCOMX|nr:hypothetical protein F2P81_014229 [Scophthalmus maximus]
MTTLLGKLISKELPESRKTPSLTFKSSDETMSNTEKKNVQMQRKGNKSVVIEIHFHLDGRAKNIFFRREGQSFDVNHFAKSSRERTVSADWGSDGSDIMRWDFSDQFCISSVFVDVSNEDFSTVLTLSVFNRFEL